MRIYVSVGTHEQPFQRLLDVVQDQIQSAGDEWRVQYGVGRWRLGSSRVPATDYLTTEQVAGALEWADVMVSQASPGNVFGALDARVWPIVIGRQKRFGEHVDDHQVRFARALKEMGLATELTSVSELATVLDAERGRAREVRRSAVSRANAESGRRRDEFRRQAWPLILGQHGRD